MRAEKPAVLNLNCCRLFALLRIMALLLPAVLFITFITLRFFGFDLNPLFFPLVLFSSLLAMNLVHTKIVLKYFNLKQSKKRYLTFLSFQALCITAFFGFIFYLTEVLPELNITTLIVVLPVLFSVIAISIYFFTPFFLRFSYKIFNKVVLREDLVKKYAKYMKDLRVKAKFLQIKNGFFGLPSAMAVLPSNEIILLGSIEKIITQKEFDSVIVHELAHLKKKKSVLARSFIVFCVLGLLIFLLFPLYLLLLSAFNKTVSFLLLQGFLLAVSIIFLFILFHLKRTGEVEADELAKKTFGREVYASALKKILKANKIPEKLGSKYLLTHPSLKERLSTSKDNSILYWKISIAISAIMLAFNSLNLPNLIEFREFPFLAFIYAISIVALIGYLLKKKFSYYLYLTVLFAAIIFNSLNILGLGGFMFSEIEEYRFWPEAFISLLLLFAIVAFNLCRAWLIYKSRKVLGIKGSLK